ncbi:MAG TPA: pyridoxamine 5'-phosphate oxidase [Pyrinomonadaceae bacterium]|nr:pyridoxamine 5'-phosphate oxidase [Pyrinomonadaceae bacterium]
MTKDLAALRQEYSQHELSRASVALDPFVQFAAWFDEATEAEIFEPNAMHLGTASLDGIPSGRTVLLKGFDAQGFTFFTNYDSRKGRELTANPNCYLHFFWKELERQIFIRGTAEKVSAHESDQYFSVRPYLSQIGALASAQSSAIESREVLESRFEEMKAKYPERSVPRPEHWGGFCVTPSEFEFWQGRRSRLHDRIRYSLVENAWRIERLSP